MLFGALSTLITTVDTTLPADAMYSRCRANWMITLFRAWLAEPQRVKSGLSRAAQGVLLARFSWCEIELCRSEQSTFLGFLHNDHDPFLP